MTGRRSCVEHGLAVTLNCNHGLQRECSHSHRMHAIMSTMLNSAQTPHLHSLHQGLVILLCKEVQVFTAVLQHILQTVLHVSLQHPPP